MNSAAGSRARPIHPDAVEQATRSGRAPVRLALRWLVGMGVMAYSYLREPVPIHRVEECGDPDDLAPPVSDALLDDRSQPSESGHGPLFRRRFRVVVDQPDASAAELVARVAGDLTVLLPAEVAAVSPRTESRALPGPGDEFLVRMPGPWDGPVRVVHRDEGRMRLATLRGHLEAGQIEFRATDAEDGSLVFEIETWARPATATVRLLYTDLRLAKEMQLYTWVRSCEAAADLAGGRVRDGVDVLTRRVEIAPRGRRLPWPPPRR
ncbi:MAG TPA: DUF1990 family protein [Actinomycetospora sp.]|uniref:DUF1990 family protein n=1 Tax=Actinomycetospora sp. TaxID=1872135 RepID=UPI002F41CE37